ncbi:Hypp2600 [Branchiostoma lanceolatum]|uniref:Hypp2600 protein n=1 Tax=Branchiostoma lanceolatum TaxID=7740 RepID=A0A8J9ZVJ6_BRALA|nr:Hypp2600 [Branchiostoma lanceolatum]
MNLRFALVPLVLIWAVATTNTGAAAGDTAGEDTVQPDRSWGRALAVEVTLATGAAARPLPLGAERHLNPGQSENVMISPPNICLEII